MKVARRARGPASANLHKLGHRRLDLGQKNAYARVEIVGSRIGSEATRVNRFDRRRSRIAPCRVGAATGEDEAYRHGSPDEANHLGGFSTPLSSPFRKNILIYRSSKSPNNSRRPAPWRGVAQRHETRSGMRWTLGARLTGDAAGGRRSRVVLTPRCWRQV